MLHDADDVVVSEDEVAAYAGTQWELLRLSAALCVVWSALWCWRRPPGHPLRELGVSLLVCALACVALVLWPGVPRDVGPAAAQGSPPFPWMLGVRPMAVAASTGFLLGVLAILHRRLRLSTERSPGIS